MALITSLPEGSLVSIIGAMAPDAITLRRDFCRRFGRVARMALQALMRSRQLKPRLRRVVKAPARPCVRVMALSAIGAQSAFVLFILMTFGTGTRDVLEIVTAMALLARHHRMLADQGKARDVMIEGHLCAPTGFLVAGLALGAE